MARFKSTMKILKRFQRLTAVRTRRFRNLPLFSLNADIFIMSQIDDLTQTTQSLVNLQQNRSRSESPFTNNGQIIAANRPGPPNSARSLSQSVGRTYFRQHLFNNIFRAKCSNAFTAVGIMDHPFDHFVTVRLYHSSRKS